MDYQCNGSAVLMLEEWMANINFVITGIKHMFNNKHSDVASFEVEIEVSIST